MYFRGKNNLCQSIWAINKSNLSGNFLSDPSLLKEEDIPINFDVVKDFQHKIDTCVYPRVRMHIEYPQLHVQNTDTNDVFLISTKDIGINILYDEKLVYFRLNVNLSNLRFFIAPSKLISTDVPNDTVTWLPDQRYGEEFGIFKPITLPFNTKINSWLAPYDRHYIINMV